MGQRSRRSRSFADRLNDLFHSVRPPGQGREYTNSEVAEATKISGSYIGYLRNGVRGNPSVEAVQALARFFRVRPSYFVDDEDDEERAALADAQLKLVQALEKPGIRKLAMRAADADLSAAAIEAVAAMIDEVSKLEQGRHHRREGKDGG